MKYKFIPFFSWLLKSPVEARRFEVQGQWYGSLVLFVEFFPNA